MRYAVCGLSFSIRHQVCGTRSEVPVCVTVRGLWYSVCGIRYAVWGMRFGLWGVGYEACGMRYALWGMWYELQYEVWGMWHEVWGMRIVVKYAVWGIRFEVRGSIGTFWGHFFCRRRKMDEIQSCPKRTNLSHYSKPRRSRSPSNFGDILNF